MEVIGSRMIAGKKVLEITRYVTITAIVCTTSYSIFGLRRGEYQNYR